MSNSSFGIAALSSCFRSMPKTRSAPVNQGEPTTRCNHAGAGRPLVDYRYKDFGSLVSIGSYGTVANLMGGNLTFEGLVARTMYRSLYKMHQLALHGPVKVSLDTVAQLLTRRTEPHVKLH